MNYRYTFKGATTEWVACEECYPDPEWVDHMRLVADFHDIERTTEPCFFCGEG